MDRTVTRDDVIDFLDRVLEYMTDREDADCVGDPARFIPNEEMRLASECKRIMDGKWDFIKTQLYPDDDDQQRYDYETGK